MTRVLQKITHIWAWLLVGLISLLVMLIWSPSAKALPVVSCQGGAQPTIELAGDTLEITCANGPINGFAGLNNGGFDAAVVCPSGSQLSFFPTSQKVEVTCDGAAPTSWAGSEDSDNDAGGSDDGPAGGNSGAGNSQLDVASLENPTRNPEQVCDPDSTDCADTNYIIILVKWAVNILSAVVGIVVVGVIIFAGIEYSSSGGDPARVGTAKKRIVNAIMALIAYLFVYVIFQWLIPGGLFSS